MFGLVFLKYLVTKQGPRAKGRLILIFAISVCCCLFMETVTIFLCIAASLTPIQSIWRSKGLDATYAFLWLVTLCPLRDRCTKQAVMGLVLALFLFSGPLLIIFIGGYRNFFSRYVVLLLVILVLYDSAREAGLQLPGWPHILALIAACALLVVYTCNCTVYRQRLNYGRELAASGAEQIVLPILLSSGFSRNEQQWKGDISYQVYRDTPWDVSSTFIPYSQWTSFDDPPELS